MGRKPRIHYPGAFYHVMLRGNGGQAIFFDDSDRCRLYLLIQEGIERFQHRVHAFCFMENHIHLAIQVGEVPLSRIIQNFSFRYTRWINQKLKKMGHLFQGRYKAILVDADAYLLELVRYIHLNPVRVGMAKNPEDFFWSSHNAYLGDEKLPWLTTSSVLSQFSQSNAKAIFFYRKFVEEGREEERRRDFHHGLRSIKDGELFGDDNFIEDVFERINKTPPSSTDIEAVISEIFKLYQFKRGDLSAPGKGQLASEARAVAAWIVRELPDLYLVDLGRIFKRDLATLSGSIERMLGRSQSNIKLKNRMKKMGKRFNIQISQA